MSELSKKLRIKDGARVLFLGMPVPFPMADVLPTNSSIGSMPNGKFDVVMLLASNSKVLKKELPRAIAALKEDSVFWICYPKKTSGIETDLTRDTGWTPVFAAGFGPVTQVAVDEMWSALRFKVESTIERKTGVVVSASGIKWTPKAKKAVAPPDDFVNALDANEAAVATWQSLAPSHIKEYVTWIEDAKKPETRARRIEQAVKMLADGVRDRNAKYANR